MDNLVYEDNPWAWQRLQYWEGKRSPYWERKRAYWTRPLWTRITPWRLHILPVTLTIFFAGLLLAFTQFHQEAIFFSILGVTLFLTAAVGLALCPTKYQIFNEKIRIILGWVLHLDIPFSNIENFTAATWNDLWGLNLNFVNSYSGDDILQIARKRGVKIHITPWDRKLFLENLNKALADWRRGSKQ